MQGWIMLHRKLLTSELFRNEKLLKVFIYCLLKATHAEHEQVVGRQKIRLSPGQFVFGRKKAAADLEMKESTIRDYIKVLQSHSTILVKPTNKFSVITIANWELYQQNEDSTDIKHDSKRTTKGQQINTNNNVKNDKKENIIDEIQDLRLSFASEIQSLISPYWDVIKKTRKTNKVSDSIILKTMKQWEKFDSRVIQYALKKHIEAYDDGERNEKYTLGIMRNTSPDQADDFLNKKTPSTPEKQTVALKEFDFDNLY